MDNPFDSPYRSHNRIQGPGCLVLTALFLAPTIPDYQRNRQRNLS